MSILGHLPIQSCWLGSAQANDLVMAHGSEVGLTIIHRRLPMNHLVNARDALILHISAILGSR